MSHNPMVRSERVIKPATMDKLHKQAHDALSRQKSIDTGQYKRLDRLGIKNG